MAEARTDLTAADVRGICGDILDWKVAAILELRPAAADVEAAAAWAGGQDDLGRLGRPLSGTTAQVYDILTADEALEDERDASAQPS
ncbi:MAG: hypothetical protein ACOY5Y_20730 [Pseudomonadota bacterium]|jgi:hypothetical protein